MEQRTLSRINILPILISVLLLFIFAACKEKRSTFGDEFIEPNQKLRMQTETSTSLIAYTAKERPYRKRGFDYFAIGEVYDTIFGASRIGCLAEFIPKVADAETYKKGTQIKSFTLTLQIRKRFYDSDLTVEVRKLPERILNSNLDEALEDFDKYDLLASKVVKATDPTVSIDLPVELADSMMSFLHRTQFDFEQFPEVFPGIYITAKRVDETQRGQILEFNRGDGKTCMTVAWDDNEGSEQQLDFVIWTGMRRFLAIDNDLSGSKLEKMLRLDQNEQQHGGDIFLHGDGGSRVEIDFSKLREEWLEKGPMAIQRAKLTIPVSQANAPFSDTIVRSLLCFMMQGDELQLLPDTELSAEVAGGYYNRQQKCYTLNVTRFVQELLSTPTPVTKLIIIADIDHIGVNRLILHNAKTDSEKKLSVDITYTTL